MRPMVENPMVTAQQRAEQREAARDARIERATELLASEAREALFSDQPEAPISTIEAYASRAEVALGEWTERPELVDHVLQALVACARHHDEAPRYAISCIEAIAYGHATNIVHALAAEGAYDSDDQDEACDAH